MIWASAAGWSIGTARTPTATSFISAPQRRTMGMIFPPYQASFFTLHVREESRRCAIVKRAPIGTGDEVVRVRRLRLGSPIAAPAPPAATPPLLRPTA